MAARHGGRFLGSTRRRQARRSTAESAEWARGISPRAPHRSGLDTLASSGSCHRSKAAAFRRELELLLLPVGSLPTAMTCPLRSTSITPASALLQGSPPLSGASVLSASRLEPLAPFPLPSPARFSRSIQEPDRASRCLNAGCRSVSIRTSTELIPEDGSAPGFDIT